jgi:hypothetical protein
MPESVRIASVSELPGEGEAREFECREGQFALHGRMAS